MPTRSSCWTGAGSWSAARMPRFFRKMGYTRRCGNARTRCGKPRKPCAARRSRKEAGSASRSRRGNRRRRRANWRMTPRWTRTRPCPAIFDADGRIRRKTAGAVNSGPAADALKPECPRLLAHADAASRTGGHVSRDELSHQVDAVADAHEQYKARAQSDGVDGPTSTASKCQGVGAGGATMKETVHERVYQNRRRSGQAVYSDSCAGEPVSYTHLTLTT